MTEGVRLTFALAAAAVAAYALTPIAIQAAGRLEFFDRPKGYKGHAKPIPYLGGAAVLAAFVAAVLAFAGDPERTAPFLGGVAVLWVVGTIDDRRHLSPALRVAIETALAVAIWATGLGWDLAGPVVDVTATVLWVLAVVNAFNLFDNMDGASSAMAIASSAAVAVLGIVEQDAWLVAVGAALAGSCLGFLPYNLARPQAKIFLGDGGSMPIGFAVAVMVMSGASSAAAGWDALALGLLLVGLPALDTALVIVSRRRKGISVLTGGRDHLTHRTRRRLGDARAVAITLGGAQLLIGSVALVAVGIGPAAIVVVTIVALAIAGGVITLLERQEDQLLAAGEVQIPAEALDAASAKRARRPDPLSLGDLALVVFALGAALSPLARAYYDAATWVPLGLALTIVAAMGAVRRPQRLPVPAWLVLGGLTAIGLLALLSTRWADAADLAVVAANRWFVLAVCAGLGLVLVRSLRRDVIAIGALLLGTLAVAVVVVVQLLGADAATLFLGGRLHRPLGYINAEATVFLMGLWLCMPAVEQRRGVLAGAGTSVAVLFIGLAVLSASRGAALAFIAAALVVLVAIPGRLRRVVALSVIVGAVGAALGPLLNVYDATLAAGGVTPVAAIHDAIGRLLLVAFGAGVVWGAFVAIEARLGDGASRQLQLAGRVAVGAAALGAAIVAIASFGSISDRLDQQWKAFTHVAADNTSSPTQVSATERLVSGAGNRYDYWRVAWDAFEDQPVTGIGAGNFDHVWFEQRGVAEAVRQPHSIELQVISELGLLGGAALLLVLGGFAAALVQTGRVARAGTVPGAVAIAAAGVPVTWLAHSSIDWMHLIPGTSAVALLMLAVLLRLREHAEAEYAGEAARVARARETEAAGSEVGARSADEHAGAATAPSAAAPGERGLRPGSLIVAATIALVIATVGATLSRQAFADHLRSLAFTNVRTDPAQAVRDADRSLRVNPDAPRTYYAKAAALARLDRGAAADAVLREAVERDPKNAVTWTLIGDLATRRGLTEDARKAYAEASRLDPLDPSLRALAAG